MKTRFTIIFTVISLIGAACGTQDSADKSGPHDGTNHNAGSGPLKSGNENAIDHSKMDHSSMGHSMTSSPNAASAEYDLQFIDTMIAHHQAAIDMAKLIDRRTERPELKKLGGNVVVSQQKEIDEMKAWRENWFAGKAPAINMGMGGMKDSMAGMDMKKLAAATGKAFDVEFIKQMIPHHKGAVAMGKEALQRSTRDEIKTLANAIIREQNAEIEMMKAWQKEWSR